MANIPIYGRTNKTDGFVKVENQDENLLKNKILPDLIDLENAVQFTPDWKKEDDELYFVDLSEHQNIIEKYLNALNSSGDYNKVQQIEFSKLNCIFAGIQNEDGSWNIKFQRLYPRYYFERAFFSFDEECKLKDSARIIILNTKTDAYYDGITQKLYFKDFSQVNQITNLMQFYRDATVEDFNKLNAITILNVQVLHDRVGQRASKKIAQMIDGKVFENKTLQQLQTYAQNYGQTLKLDVNSKILIESNDDINLIFDIVNERYFEGEFSGRRYKTNSVQAIEVNLD
jgi:hypothetical protein